MDKSFSRRDIPRDGQDWLCFCPLAVTLMTTISLRLYSVDDTASREFTSRIRSSFHSSIFFFAILFAICESDSRGRGAQIRKPTTEQRGTIAAIGRRAGKIAGAAKPVRQLNPPAKVAKELNAAGQTRTAGRTISEGGKVASGVTQKCARKVFRRPPAAVSVNLFA